LLELIGQNQPAIQQCFSLTINQHQLFSSAFTASQIGPLSIGGGQRKGISDTISQFLWGDEDDDRKID
jgi:hypothetical protein